MRFFVVFFAVCPLLVTSVTNADTYGTAADLTGTRSFASDLILSGVNADDHDPLSPVPANKHTGFTIDWTITDNFNGTWDYLYTLTPILGSPAISHFTLDVTDDLIDNDDLIGFSNYSYKYFDDDLNLQSGAVEAVANDPSSSIIGALKLEPDDSQDGPVIFGFTSTRDPVWGHFYTKSDNTDYAWNKALTESVDLNNTSFYVARPNGAQTIPEPSVFIGLGSMLSVALIGRFWRWKRSLS